MLNRRTADIAIDVMRPAGEALEIFERLASHRLLVLALSCAVPLALLSRQATQSAPTHTDQAYAKIGYKQSQTCLEVESGAYLVEAISPVFIGMW